MPDSVEDILNSLNTESARGAARLPANADQIRQAAQSAGFSGDALDTMVAIAMAESRGNPSAVLDTRGKSDAYLQDLARKLGVPKVSREHSVGLWQINALAHGSKFGTPEQLMDPVANAKAAYQISGGGRNFSPWTTYKTGSYKQYLTKGGPSSVEDVLASIGQPQSTPPTNVYYGSQDQVKPKEAYYGSQDMTPAPQPQQAPQMSIRETELRNRKTALETLVKRLENHGDVKEAQQARKDLAVIYDQLRTLPKFVAKPTQVSADGSIKVGAAQPGKQVPFVDTILRPLSQAYTGAKAMVGQAIQSPLDEAQTYVNTPADALAKIAKQKLPNGLFLTDATSKKLDSFGFEGKKLRATLNNLDITQVPAFVAAITAGADKTGDPGLKATANGFMDTFYKATVGQDPDAGAELLGMYDAFIIQAATAHGGAALKEAVGIRPMNVGGKTNLNAPKETPKLPKGYNGEKPKLRVVDDLAPSDTLNNRIPATPKSPSARSIIGEAIAKNAKPEIKPVAKPEPAPETITQPVPTEPKPVSEPSVTDAYRKTYNLKNSPEVAIPARVGDQPGVSNLGAFADEGKPSAGTPVRGTAPRGKGKAGAPEPTPKNPTLTENVKPTQGQKEPWEMTREELSTSSTGTGTAERYFGAGGNENAVADVVSGTKPTMIGFDQKGAKSAAKRYGLNAAPINFPAPPLGGSPKAPIWVVFKDTEAFKRLEKAYLDGNNWNDGLDVPMKVGDAPRDPNPRLSPTAHSEIGRALGYSEADIAGFYSKGDNHKSAVESALKEGKPVPNEVLTDYPDLAAKYGKKEPAVSTQGMTPTPNTPKPIEAPQKPVQSPETGNVKPAFDISPAKPKPSGPEFDLTPSDTEGRALANRSTDITKKLIGEPQYQGVPKQTVEQWAKGAVEKGYTDPANAHNIAKDVLSGNKKFLDNEETVGLASSLHDLEGQFDTVSKKLLAKSEQGGDVQLSAQLDDITQKMSDIAKAGNASGVEWGRSGVARQAIMKAEGSFESLLARRQNAAKRALRTDEITAIRDQVKKLKEVRDEIQSQIDKKLAEKDLVDAQDVLREHARRGGSKATGEKLIRVEAKIKDVGARLQAKWKENKPAPITRGSLFFGADIIAEQALRVGKIAPEILELAKLHVEKGAIKLADNVSAVVKQLKELGIDDITDNDVAAVLAGRIKGEREARPKTDYENLKSEASDVFTKAEETRAERLRAIADKEAEVKRQARTAQRKSDLEMLKKDREEIESERKASRDAERAFWKDVSERQKEYDAGESSKSKAARAEYVKWWQEKGSQMQKMIERLEKEEAAAPIIAEKMRLRAEKIQAEKALRDQQRAFMKDATIRARLEREASIRRWKGSAQGQRSQAMNRMDNVIEKLDFADANGEILGSKMKVNPPEDAILNGLLVKEAMLKRQWRLEEHQIKMRRLKEQRTPLNKATDLALAPFRVVFSALTTADFSWSGLQGGLVPFMNPKAWAKGAKSSVLSMFSREATYAKRMEAIRQMPNFDKIAASGVDLPGLQPEHKGEWFVETVLDRTPGLGQIRQGSEQAFNGAATVTRANLVDGWINAIESTGRPLTPEALKVLGDGANILTGKAGGKLGQAISSVEGLRDGLFSPSWWVSQWQGLTGKPLRDALQYGYKSKDWRPAKLMTKEYAKITGGATATLVGTAYAVKYAKDMGWTDWEIEIDPQKRMFGKAWVVRNGKMISVDFLPPQMSAPIKQLIQGTIGEKSDKGTILGGKYNRVQSIGNTLEGKYAPLPRIGFGIADSMFASDNPGKDNKPSYAYGTNLDPRTGEGRVNLAASSLTPISAQQEYRTIATDELNFGEKAIISLLSLWGRGASIYPVKK